LYPFSLAAEPAADGNAAITRDMANAILREPREMRDVLFRNPKQLNAESLPVHAETLSLDMNAFNACLQSERHLAEIDQDAKDAKAVRLTGTPSFIIGKSIGDTITGQVVIGAQSMNTFDSAINKALAQQTVEKQTP
jgi:predicted DsbA family dithiol-disulfide isomerase